MTHPLSGEAWSASKTKDKERSAGINKEASRYYQPPRLRRQRKGAIFLMAQPPRLPKELLLSWDQLHSEFFGLFRKPFKSSVFILFFVSLLPNIEVFPTQSQQTVNE